LSAFRKRKTFHKKRQGHGTHGNEAATFNGERPAQGSRQMPFTLGRNERKADRNRSDRTGNRQIARGNRIRQAQGTAPLYIGQNAGTSTGSESETLQAGGSGMWQKTRSQAAHRITKGFFRKTDLWAVDSEGG